MPDPPSRLLDILPAPPLAPIPEGYLLAPWLADLPPASRDLIQLLPITDVNAATFALIAATPPPAGAIVSLMLANPFLRVRDALGAFARAGVSRVANFPTVQLIDGETARALDGAHLGAS